MHSAIIFCLLGFAFAAPQGQGLVRQEIARPQPALILTDERISGDDGAYSFQFETENGILQTETGSQGVSGGATVQGTYSYVLDDGSVATAEYSADENGFRVQSPLVPVAPAFPHPIPEHVVNNIRVAEELKAQGVQFDHRGFRLN
ncbi:unnamed protein product [Meganyctiphanes norvegica]|uniref:Uncharacterized protein n=1 Tax=Meganyctiphanes norvegica TaxID=48144 RepID=A0AAV2Q195_MEGNR